MLRVLYICLLFTVCFTIAAPAMAAESYGCILLVDGLRGDKALEHAQDGLMPNVKKYFLDKGIWVNNACAVAPSITGAAVPSIITGAFPGRHNLPSLTWFQRDEEKIYDLFTFRQAFSFNKLIDTKKTRTLFEFFPGKKDSWSFGLPISRGADDSVAVSWTLGYKPIVFRAYVALALRKLRTLFTHEDAPRLTIAYSGWFDHTEHVTGVDTPEMAEHYENVDWMVGEAIKLYKEQGLFDKTYFVLVSDHGQYEFSSRHNTLGYYKDRVSSYEQSWLKLPFVAMPWSIRQAKDYSDYASVVTLFDSQAFVYVAGNPENPSWQVRPTYEEIRQYPLNGRVVDFVEETVNYAPVEICAAMDRQKNLVHVFGKNGAQGEISRIQKDGQWFYRYTVMQNRKDPLYYLDTETTKRMVYRGQNERDDDFYFSDRAWLEASCTTEHPDAVVLHCQIFDCERAPDIFVSPQKGAALMPKGPDISGHGSMIKEQMHATFAVSGPGIGRQRLAAARTVDVAPTILHCLNYPHSRAFFDGHVLSPVAELLPAPSTAPAPPVSRDEFEDSHALEGELKALNGELINKLSDNYEFTDAQVRQILVFLGDLTPDHRQYFRLFVVRLVKTLSDPVLKEQLNQIMD